MKKKLISKELGDILDRNFSLTFFFKNKSFKATKQAIYIIHMKNRLVRLQTMNNKETIKDNTLRERSIREAIKPSPECAYIKDNCRLRTRHLTSHNSLVMHEGLQ